MAAAQIRRLSERAQQAATTAMHSTLPEYHPTRISDYWRKYHIATPGLSLTPVEKPDTSPYLIHMTGKAEIASIIRGKGAVPPVSAGHGFLRASIPSQSKGNYFAEVVCFTESPTFAIDFFRYRSVDRWKRDMLYGVGFAKEGMVKNGVFPALYLSKNDKDQLVAIHAELKAKQEAVEDDSLAGRLQALVKSIYPLCTPLGEDLAPYQGFHWEREWRFPKPPGLVFSHSDIRLICCPDDERGEISELLGEHSKNVRFVRTWAEFSEVTDFMERQHNKWAAQGCPRSRAEAVEDAKSALRGKEVALISLEAYRRKLEQAQSELAQAAEAKAQLENEIAELKKQIGEPDTLPTESLVETTGRFRIHGWTNRRNSRLFALGSQNSERHR